LFPSAGAALPFDPLAAASPHEQTDSYLHGTRMEVTKRGKHKNMDFFKDVQKNCSSTTDHLVSVPYQQDSACGWPLDWVQWLELRADLNGDHLGEIRTSITTIPCNQQQKSVFDCAWVAKGMFTG